MSGLEKEAQELRDLLESIEKILGSFPMSISDPVFPTLTVPEIEWERRIIAMIQEYHLFVQTKVMEIIDTVLPISFEVPIMGLSIDVVKLFTDPNYKVTLKAQISADVDSFYALLPDTYKTFDGTYGLEVNDFKAEAVWNYIMSQLNKGALGIIYGAFGGLIEKFSSIWSALGLPDLPALTDLNVEGLIQARIQAIEEKIKNLDPKDIDAAEALRREGLAALEKISLVGYSLMDLLGGEPNDFVESLEKKMDRFKTRLRDFGEEWPEFLIKEWMQKVTKFFEAIGLGDLVQWITFTFCDFLKLIKFPSSIAIPAGITVTIPAIKNLPVPAVDINGVIIPAGEPGSNQFPTLTPPPPEEE
tara:strand:+ start:162 stop:1238 length:1077 start_codon:yes stop_codon:yes gene_type:complete